MKNTCPGLGRHQGPAARSPETAAAGAYAPAPFGAAPPGAAGAPPPSPSAAASSAGPQAP